MLQVPLVSLLYPSKNGVALKITIVLVCFVRYDHRYGRAALQLWQPRLSSRVLKHGERKPGQKRWSKTLLIRSCSYLVHPPSSISYLFLVFRRLLNFRNQMVPWVDYDIFFFFFLLLGSILVNYFPTLIFHLIRPWWWRGWTQNSSWRPKQRQWCRNRGLSESRGKNAQ